MMQLFYQNILWSKFKNLLRYSMEFCLLQIPFHRTQRPVTYLYGVLGKGVIQKDMRRVILVEKKTAKMFRNKINLTTENCGFTNLVWLQF